MGDQQRKFVARTPGDAKRLKRFIRSLPVKHNTYCLQTAKTATVVVLSDQYSRKGLKTLGVVLVYDDASEGTFEMVEKVLGQEAAENFYD